MHTPTPWHVEEDSNGDTWIRIPGHDLYVCNLEGSCGECYGNANFIVTACNAHDALVAALTEAIDLIRIWHGIQNGAAAWNIYAAHSPEMKRLYAALALVAPKEAVR